MAGSEGPSGGIARYDDERTLLKQGKPNSRADLYKNRGVLKFWLFVK